MKIRFTCDKSYKCNFPFFRLTMFRSSANHGQGVDKKYDCNKNYDLSVIFNKTVRVTFGILSVFFQNSLAFETFIFLFIFVFKYVLVLISALVLISVLQFRTKAPSFFYLDLIYASYYFMHFSLLLLY